MTSHAVKAQAEGRHLLAQMRLLFLPMLVLAASLIFTHWLWQSARLGLSQELQTNFGFRAREVSAAIAQRMNSYEQVLRGVAGLFNQRGAELKREEFGRYVAKLHLDQAYPGIQGVGFSLWLSHAEKERHLEDQRRSGQVHYRIEPDGEREVYAPVVFFEPPSEINLGVLGKDAYAAPVLRTAMDRARDLEKPIVSRMRQFERDAGSGRGAGFNMYLPIYAFGFPHESFDERRANIAGWAFASFRMNDLMEGVLGERTDDVSIQIFDGEVMSPASLMYESSGLVAPDDESASAATALSIVKYIDLGGHTWAASIRAQSGFGAEHDLGKPVLIVRVGFAVSLLLTLLTWVFVYSRSRVFIGAARIAAAEGSYRSMFDNALDAVFLLRGDVCIDCNATAESLLLARRDQIVGQPQSGHSPERQSDGRLSRDAFREFVRTAYDGKQPRFEWLHRRSDGSPVYCDVALRCVTISGESLILVNVHDISERKKVEEKIKLTSSELETLLQSAVVGIFSVSERRHQWVNSRFAEMTGYAPEELVGQSTLIHMPSEQSWLELGELAYPVINRGETFSIDWQVKRKDGSLFWAQMFGKCIDANDLAKGSIWTYLDVSERKKAEAETYIALEQQRELNHLKSRFVSMTSHEFRTPLATILSSAELLKYYSDKLPADERGEVILSIEKGVKRMAKMLDDILVIGKVDADKIAFHPRSLDLYRFCDSLVSEARTGSNDLGLDRCTIEVRQVGDAGNRQFDEDLLRHILGNLLSNAVKYSRQGGQVFFGVVCRPAETEFTVADQGIGLPESDVSRLFETFYRASNVGNIAGTGLGLAIVKRSVDLHGGTISVGSVLGEGTQFVVTLPC